MYSYQRHDPPDPSIYDIVTENILLREQIKNLSERVSVLETENRLLRVGAVAARLQPGQLYAAPTDNALALPAVIENLAVLRDHFRRQGTLRQWYVQVASIC